MFTVTFSAGGVFTLGLCLGVLTGVVGLTTIAMLYNKSKGKKGE